MQRLTVLGLAVAAAIELSGCSSTSDAPASTPPPTSAAPAGLDPCLVGTWRSTGTTGTLTIGGSKVAVAGGAGEVITITAAGTIHTDESGAAPVGGAASDGTQYVLTQTGTAGGHINGGGGRMAVTLDQPSTLTVTLLKNGNPIASQHPGSATDTYSCAAGSSLTITGSGNTVSRYVPG